MQDILAQAQAQSSVGALLNFVLLFEFCLFVQTLRFLLSV